MYGEWKNNKSPEKPHCNKTHMRTQLKISRQACTQTRDALSIIVIDYVLPNRLICMIMQEGKKKLLIISESSNPSDVNDYDK